MTRRAPARLLRLSSPPSPWPCACCFLTDLLANLPKAVLAAVVLTAVAGLIDVPALVRMWRISKLDFYAATIALGAVLLLGILQGILLAAAASILLLLARVSQPHVAYLGRIPGTSSYSDLERHPENEPLPNLIAFRPEASLLYVNANSVSQSVSDHGRALGAGKIWLSSATFRRHLISTSPARACCINCIMNWAPRGINLRIVGARGRVRDLLRAEGIGEKVGGLDRRRTLRRALGKRPQRGNLMGLPLVKSGSAKKGQSVDATAPNKFGR